MERDAALADFEAAREEWEAAFSRVPDGALTYLKPGDDVNLEVDIIAKYVERMMKRE